MLLKFRFSRGMAFLACPRSYRQVGGAAPEGAPAHQFIAAEAGISAQHDRERLVNKQSPPMAKAKTFDVATPIRGELTWTSLATPILIIPARVRKRFWREFRRNIAAQIHTGAL
jgi:hypothetical protein